MEQLYVDTSDYKETLLLLAKRKNDSKNNYAAFRKRPLFVLKRPPQFVRYHVDGNY